MEYSYYLVDCLYTLPGAIFANFANSSFYSIIFLLYSRVKRKIDLKAGTLFLITFWISFEKFHLNWEFSWPWLNLGNVFSRELIGFNGMSLLEYLEEVFGYYVLIFCCFITLENTQLLKITEDFTLGLFQELFLFFYQF